MILNLFAHKKISVWIPYYEYIKNVRQKSTVENPIRCREQFRKEKNHASKNTVMERRFLAEALLPFLLFRMEKRGDEVFRPPCREGDQFGIDVPGVDPCSLVQPPVDQHGAKQTRLVRVVVEIGRFILWADVRHDGDLSVGSEDKLSYHSNTKRAPKKIVWVL